MPGIYGRDLDLNLLRVFAVVAESASVTDAAKRLYMTQPAVSAALRRLTTAVGAPLFVRSGRGLSLTSRGQRLQAGLSQHLQAVVDAALAPATFDPKTSDRTVRVGLSDASELWLLPPLLRTLEREAPKLRIVSIPVQFRTVGAALGSGLAAAVTVADELPSNISREPLLGGGFCCLFDPRHVKIKTLTESIYFSHEHVIVSYNGDLRGIIEDLFGQSRSVRCSVSSFAHIGAIIDGSSLLATIPELVAQQICKTWPHLKTKPLPLRVHGTQTELLWPRATEDDAPCQFVRAKIKEIARRQNRRLLLR